MCSNNYDMVKINKFPDIDQARSCLYASTQLNPHYFDKKNIFCPKTHQIAPFISKFSGGGMPPDPPRLF